MQVGGPPNLLPGARVPGACTPGRKERHRQHGRTKCGKKKGILGGFLLEKFVLESILQPALFKSKKEPCIAQELNVAVCYLSCCRSAIHCRPKANGKKSIATMCETTPSCLQHDDSASGIELFSPPFLRYKPFTSGWPHPSGIQESRGSSLYDHQPKQCTMQVQKSFEKLTIDLFIYINFVAFPPQKKTVWHLNDPQKRLKKLQKHSKKQ